MRFLIMLISLFFLNNTVALSLTLKSQGFVDKGVIPNKYTCKEGNNSPELNWASVPAKTRSLVLTLTSLDTPVGKINLWTLYNLPANLKSLPEGMTHLPDGTMVGKNELGEMGYRGPCPPDRKNHRFVFTLYALDTELDLSSGEDADVVIKKIQGHILQKAKLRGTFKHQ